MYNIPLLNSEIFAWVILPILIFFARVIDVTKRKNVGDVIGMIKQFNVKAFFSIEEVRVAKEGVFPTSNNKFSFFGSNRFNRTGK